MIPEGHRTVILENWQTLSFNSRGTTITCKEGRVWITWPRSGDVVLETGQQMRIECRGKICLQALRGSVVCLQPLAPRPRTASPHGKHRPLPLQSPAW